MPCLNFTLFVPSKKKSNFTLLVMGLRVRKRIPTSRGKAMDLQARVSHDCHWVVLLQILATKSPSYCLRVVLMYKLCFSRTTRTLSLRLWDSLLIIFLVENQRLWDSPILEVGSSSSVYINGLDQILNLLSLREVQRAWPTKPLRLAIGSLSNPIQSNKLLLVLVIT